jgi:predicted membrane protein
MSGGGWTDEQQRKIDEKRRLREERWERSQERWERRWDRRTSGGGVVFGTPGHGSAVGRFVAGGIIVLLGVAFLLQNLGFLYIDHIWNYWPLLLVALGISHVLTGPLQRRVWGLGLVAVGLVLLANSLGYLRWDVWRLLWPMWLIFFGLSLLAGGFGRRRYGRWGFGPGPFTPGVAVSSENAFRDVAVFGGVQRRVESQDFEGGSATAIFGGVEIDLRPAATKKSEVVIEANAIFGGVELRVPDTWDVTVDGSGILGGYENRTMHGPSPEGQARPHLLVRGDAVLGGVSVRN